MKIDTSEVRELAAALESEGGRVGKKVAVAVRKGGKVVEAVAKQNAPVDTGDLRGDIRSRVAGDGRSGGIAAVIETSKRQGFFQEHGTSRHPAQPYMRVGLAAARPGFISALERIAAEALK